MIFSLSPMEGLTGHVYRKVQAECFEKLDRYYTPFLAPPRVGSSFGKRAAKELDSVYRQDLTVIPQLLTKNADEFVWAARLLSEMGFTEVNLNLGCPSGTVVAKGKGSGFLQNLDELSTFLDNVCTKSCLPVSVKTRVGVSSDEEYEKILDLYCKFPLTELIVHPRVQKDGYKGVPRQQLYGKTLAQAAFPVAYNGDIFSSDEITALLSTYPKTRHIMLGRGVLTNPALIREWNGGTSLSIDELEHFHNRLFQAYMEEMGGNAVFRMKEWWCYAKYAFSDPRTVHRTVRKTRSIKEYAGATERVFHTERLADIIRFQAQ